MTYWTIEVELADAAEAERIAAIVRAALPAGRVVIPVDPSAWLTWHCDEASVRALHQARRGLARDTGDVVAGGLLEDVEEWLAARGA